jgi:predicted house-cleaning noncanonical NTP pyrophosphatase (MazG superfamily)
MREFEVNKLVRDGIVPQMSAAGAEVKHRTLIGQELDEAIKAKFIEEAVELQSAGDVTGELADILELIYVLATLHTISMADVESSRETKQEQSGGFSTGSFVESIILPDDSDWIDHYSSRSEKYPEIT